MKVIGLIMIALVLLASCTQKVEEPEVKGTLYGLSNGSIYIVNLLDKNSNPDSVAINANGDFSFDLTVDEPTDYVLHTDQQNFIRLMLLPGENVYIKADADDLQGTYTVEGSHSSSEIRRLMYGNLMKTVKLDSLNMVYKENEQNPDLPSILIELQAASQKLYEEERSNLETYIKDNKDPLASYVALSLRFGNESIFNPITDFEYFEIVDTALASKYPNSRISAYVHNFVNKVKSDIEQRKTMEQRLGVGATAPDIALPSPYGDTIKLSSLRGKYVLLDFWASWCKPCRLENPNLVQNYYKYKWKGFEVFQVSLDRSKEDWVQAIRKDRLNWKHVSDLKFWQSSAAELYNVKSIPASFLIDPEGKIIAKNLRGEQLGEKLEEVFNPKNK